MVIPFHNFRVGIGISESYSTSLQFGDLLVTTEENPDGTGKILEVTYETRVDKKSAIVSYSKATVFLKNDQISVGGQYNFNSMNHDFSLSSASTIDDVETNSQSWSAGVKYSMFEVGVEQIHFGVFFEKSVNFAKTVTFNDSLPATPGGIFIVPPAPKNLSAACLPN